MNRASPPRAISTRVRPTLINCGPISTNLGESTNFGQGGAESEQPWQELGGRNRPTLARLRPDSANNGLDRRRHRPELPRFGPTPAKFGPASTVSINFAAKFDPESANFGLGIFQRWPGIAQVRPHRPGIGQRCPDIDRLRAKLYQIRTNVCHCWTPDSTCFDHDQIRGTSDGGEMITLELLLMHIACVPDRSTPPRHAQCQQYRSLRPVVLHVAFTIVASGLYMAWAMSAHSAAGDRRQVNGPYVFACLALHSELRGMRRRALWPLAQQRLSPWPATRPMWRTTR